MTKTALIIEGGALRTFFSMGVIDYLLEKQLQFDYVCGVSAGSMIGLNYIAQQKKRSMHVDLRFLHDSRYMGIRPLLHYGEFFNLDFLCGPIVNQEYPLNFQQIQQSTQRLEAVVTNCFTGRSEFLSETGYDYDLHAVKASSSYPLASKIKWLHGQPYLDGSISNSLPYQRALDQGYDKVVVVCTRDAGYQMPMVNLTSLRLMRRYYHKYPNLVTAYQKRPQSYNQQFQKMLQLQTTGKIFVIQPVQPLELANTETNLAYLYEVYQRGWQLCQTVWIQLRSFLDS
ncbi:patatin-like phospholipase family protein [Bombilactobacillus thymidiniphilus]|uniref:Patatin family protein n=1 Tax=Bombilactobacillus thymidiniphilus TaxID=2923363 RepID=A0ABY4PE77_9LACO|nr:patatin family protein [Bombilactobacillus thymidiniphilus]UQS84094.1 patatin family protein [Bombilactobacillus thymidiniphilus]